MSEHDCIIFGHFSCKTIMITIQVVWGIQRMKTNWLFITESMQGSSHGVLSGVCKGFSIDSRTVKQGELYFALSGDRFDGHHFAGAAIQNGAAAVVVQKERCSDIFPRIEVTNPLTAMQMLAGAVRNTLNIPVIAITGSHGKTTTKDMLASIMSQHFKTASTFQNLNGLIGVPLTLLNMNQTDQMLIIEVGISKPGEMEILASVVRPSDAIFTCVAAAHSEFMPTLDIIAHEKKKLMDQILPGGHAILNADDPVIMKTCHYSNSVLYGIKSGDYRAEISSASSNSTAITVNEPGQNNFTFQLPLKGIHNVYNALASIAVARIYGMSPTNIQKGFDSTTVSPHRSQIIKLKNLTIIDDAYNAAPRSMRCALQILKDLDVSGRRIAVLGDMLELGVSSAAEHDALGSALTDYSIDLLVAFGKFSEILYQAARETGINGHYFPDAKTVAEFLPELTKKNDTILVKASRSMHAEQIVQALKEIHMSCC